MHENWLREQSGKAKWLALGAIALLVACSSSTGSGGSVTGSRTENIAAFPADVRPLLTSDIPDDVIAALLKVRQSGPNTLVLNDGGGELFQAEQVAYVSNWEKITGWTVKDIAPIISAGQLQAQVQSGQVQMDLLEAASGDALLEQSQNLLDKFDPSLIGPVISKYPAAGGYYPSNYWLQYSFFGVVILWDTRIWPASGNHPSTPKDLFDTTTFPGKRCLFDYPEYGATLEYALLADGVPGNQLYPLDVPRAEKKLDTIKSQIVWWDAGATPVQNIVNGSCAIATAWHGRPALRLKSDPSLRIGVSWQNILMIDSGWTIPKGASHPAAANSLMAFDFTPKNQCALMNTIGYGIPFDESCIDSFGNTWGMTAAHRAQAAAAQDRQYYNTHITDLSKQFSTWLTS
jgi:putative spermidine/putrescine transport system substrate-binding protein